jgi:predicted nucleotidyltransferase component of viral defense system
MLHTESVAPATLGLLKKLTQLPSLQNFNLVGGTALALQIGHRVSVDLDFFNPNPFEVEDVLREIKAENYNITIIGKQSNNLNILVNGVKVDILKYTYPLIKPSIEVEGVKMLAKEDIAAMKLSAITNRGDKKDFTDLYFLLKEIDFNRLIDFYKEKYQIDEVFHVYKSLVYFEDADLQADLKMLKSASWDEIKSFFKNLISKI